MTHDMPTPESLEAEAAELETLAASKEASAHLPHRSPSGRDAMLQDARIFRDEARSKRERADRLRKAAAQAEVDDAARHALEHEGAGQHEALDEANHFAQ